MKQKPYYTQKDLFNHVFFNPDKASAEDYLKRNNVAFTNLRLNKVQLHHTDNWKTWKYTPKRR